MLKKKSYKIVEKQNFVSLDVDSNRQIKNGVIISFIGMATKILSGCLYIPWMVNQIGQDNYGIYIIATSLISIFLLDFGLGAAVTRFISQYNAEGNQAGINNLLGVIYKLFIFIDIIIFIVLVSIFFLLGEIYKNFTPLQLYKFKIVYIIVAVFSVISFPFTNLGGILYSYEKFVALKICDLIQKILTDLLVILALLCGFGLYALVTVNAIMGLFIIFIKLILVKLRTPVKANLKCKSKTILKQVLSFSMWITILSIAQRFIFNVTPSILGMVAGVSCVSVFGISCILEGYVYNIANAINGLFLPKISRIIIQKNAEEKLLQLMIKIGRIQFFVVGFIIVNFISFGKEFILLWMGQHYILAYYCTILLILPSIISWTQQIGDTAIVAYNKVKLQAVVFVVMGVINIMLFIPLSRIWGAIGGSLAICISYCIRLLGSNVIYCQILKLNIFEFFMQCHIKLVKPLFISLLMGKIVNHLIPGSNFYNFIVKVTLIAFLYFLLMWFQGFNLYEKDMIINFVRQFVKKERLK